MKSRPLAFLFACVIGAGLSIHPARAQVVAPMPVIDASSLLKEANIIRNQLKALDNQIQQINAAKRSIQSLPYTVWSRVQSNVNQLRDILAQEKNIALTSASAASEFDNLNPNYAHGQDVAGAYLKWWAVTEQASDAAVRTTAAILGQQPADLDALSREEDQVANAQGQTAVAQAAATIAAQEVEQLHKLITLEAIDSHYRRLANARRDAHAAASQAATDWLRGASPSPEP